MEGDGGEETGGKEITHKKGRKESYEKGRMKIEENKKKEKM